MFYSEAGWVGMITFLAAYYLVSSKKLDSSGVAYNVMNILGAAAIAYSLLPLQAWSTIALESCFMLIGTKTIVAKLRAK